MSQKYGRLSPNHPPSEGFVAGGTSPKSPARGKFPSGLSQSRVLRQAQLSTHIKLLAVAGLMVVVILAAACQGDEAATPTSTEAPTPTPTPTPTAAPTATAVPTPTPAVQEPGPTDRYFSMDRVLDIAIEIAPEDWDTLRHQTRTFEDLIAEIEKYGLSQPFASIYTWFPGTVTVDGEVYTEVGVRKKGFLGSQSETKPSLKLRFDKYVEGQALGGAVERMALNNSIQDSSMINTCLAYQVFAAAGSPTPRCNFATVSVNGKNLGLYVHVEEYKSPFLARHFANAEGNLYEGTVSDFTPEYRGTFEKKTNEDADDWSDIDAVVAALQDPSAAGLESLAEAVDLDRFLTFWATEVLVGHWDGYSGDRNNYYFYREPDDPFVFIPAGADDVFHLKDDPNPFDNISDPPPSVLALAAIPNRLYRNDDWRAKYVARLKELLDTAWNEEYLLDSVDEMATIVQEHALPESRAAAAADAERVRQFIMKRRAEILDDLTPEPPEWPAPDQSNVPLGGFEPGNVELHFETDWGTNRSINPFGEGQITYLALNGMEQHVTGWGMIAGVASAEERDLLPATAEIASLAALVIRPDGSFEGFTIAVSMDRLFGGAILVIGEDEVAGGRWSIPAGSADLDRFSLFTEGLLELDAAGSERGAAITGRFYGAWGGAQLPGEGEGTVAMEVGLVINEIAASGEPLDWVELYNASESHLALANFVLSDDLLDAGKRTAFPADLVVPPGGYLQVELDKENWPGFALGQDEELGIWTAEGSLVDSVDWADGQAGEGLSYARVPDVTGDFRTVSNPTPGLPNQEPASQ